jgi:acyl-coenzyme A synthetase/AMP-(fatty) acid ligase/thioesterase domain-containing protein
VTSRPLVMATGVVEWAAREPEQTAAVDIRRAVTLGELETAAAALAARLLDGAEPGAGDAPSWLPIVVDRSVATVVAVHGAMRAGCTFSRIESTMPRAVIAEMLHRLGSPRRAVVADPKYAELLPDGVEIISPFGHERVGAASPQPVDHEAPGYVSFTSGSTGRPKGVIVPWFALDTNIETLTRLGPSRSGGPWTEGLMHQFGAGVMLRGLALPSIGGTLCIGDPTTMSVDDLLDWFHRNEIDCTSFPASLTRAILRVADGRPRLPSVSLVRANSEASDWSLVAPLRRLIGPHLTIRSGLSATEVGQIMRLVIGPDHPIGEGRIPVGRLVPGMEVRLEPLDGDPSTTQLVVARPRTFGYLGDPELTARRYFTDEDGIRWWRSSDVMRVDDEGIYHHLGRADEMVRVKGAFVAPSRIEAALHSIDGIGDAAVLLHTAANDSVRVVAHVQVVDDTLTPEAVDAQLRQRLPRDLVPAVIVRHDELPRSQRMKVDRKALEQAPLVRWRASRARKPTTNFEWWCVAEVRRIIGIDDIGVDDDLFEAGLESISALELGATLSEAGFGDFDPPRILEARTVAGIGHMLGKPRAVRRSAVVVHNDGGTHTPFFAFPGGGGNALEWRFLADELGADQPVAVVEMRGMHTAGAPDRTVESLATSALEEIEARLDPAEPGFILAFSGGGPTAYEVAQRMHANGRRVHLVLIDSAPSTRNRERNPNRAPARLQSEMPPTIRAAAVKELPSAVIRSLRYRRQRQRFERLIRDPGPPSFYAGRYLAFRQIQSRASLAYEPAPAAFPATLVLVDGSDSLRRCGDLMPNLEVHDLGGAHDTMLVPPYVEDLASIVAAAARNFASETEPRPA